MGNKETQPEKKSGKGSGGVRYDASQKKEILKFIEDYNEKNGRGGQSAAAAQYGVSVLTLINWQKQDGTAPKAKKSKPAKKKRKSAVKKRKVSAKKGKKRSPRKTAKKAAGKKGRVNAGVGFAGKIQAILSQISSNEKTISKLEASNKSLKQKLKRSIG
ncbi:hypothetical protein [Leptospira idonii]|uniref:Uncharacterized protein n=1 Tax=Leptospira idonii TaxID=1193500 RepID=A0A4R9M185_9LEPT|nr:hypothetical protein [Leptospira idonii]TGN19812.1 hypothetical protein EHS15_06845 [Leptospira idonii]